MSDQKKDKGLRHPAPSTEPERDVRSHPETNFLPPLNMFLAFFDRDSRQKKETGQSEPDEKSVEKLIDKLNEMDEENKQ